MPFHPSTLPDLTGKVFIVTGATSGIGYHTAAHLASHNAHVYLCARTTTKATTAITSIHQNHPSATLTPLIMDHTDLSTITTAAKHFLSLETTLHGLVNNAGIMATPYSLTKDGFEEQWQTNYLAHWLFTTLLLPLMLKTAKTLPAGIVRIVNVSSSGHLGAPKEGICFEDTGLEKGSKWERYGQSKLANILHTRTLHATYGPGSESARSGGGEIWVSSVHPGVVQTNLAASLQSEGALVARLFDVFRLLGFMATADEGSWTNLYCVASQVMTAEESCGYREIHGRLFEPKWLSNAAKDEKLASRLEEWTVETIRQGDWM